MQVRVPQVPPEGWIRGWKPYLRWQKVNGNGWKWQWYRILQLWRMVAKLCQLSGVYEESYGLFWGAQSLRKLPAWKTWQFMDYGMPRNIDSTIVFIQHSMQYLWEIITLSPTNSCEESMCRVPFRATPLARKGLITWKWEGFLTKVPVKLAKLTSSNPISMACNVHLFDWEENRLLLTCASLMGGEKHQQWMLVVSANDGSL